MRMILHCFAIIYVVLKMIDICYEYARNMIYNLTPPKLCV